jgi:ankyrin repeat protein
LISNAANVNKTEHHGFTAISEAANYNNIGCVSRLLHSQNVLDISSKDKRTALMRACTNGHVEVVQCLLSDDRFLIGIDAQNSYGSTALHLASHRGHLEVVKALIEAGCSLDIVDKYGNTACHVASSDGHDKVLSLIQHRDTSIIHKKTNDQQTCIMLAAQRGHVSSFEKLLYGGSDLACRDSKGRTTLDVLHWALDKPQVDRIKTLVEAFAKRKEDWGRRSDFIRFLVSAGFLPSQFATSRENQAYLTAAMADLGFKSRDMAKDSSAEEEEEEEEEEGGPGCDNDREDAESNAVATVLTNSNYHRLVLRFV